MGAVTMPIGANAASIFNAPAPVTLSTPGVPRSVAVCFRILATWVAVSPGEYAQMSAAAAATCGAAIDVPSTRK